VFSTTPVSVAFIVMVAPATTAPVESVTIPETPAATFASAWPVKLNPITRAIDTIAEHFTITRPTAAQLSAARPLRAVLVPW